MPIIVNGMRVAKPHRVGAEEWVRFLVVVHAQLPMSMSTGPAGTDAFEVQRIAVTTGQRTFLVWRALKVLCLLGAVRRDPERYPRRYLKEPLWLVNTYAAVPHYKPRAHGRRTCPHCMGRGYLQTNRADKGGA